VAGDGLEGEEGEAGSNGLLAKGAGALGALAKGFEKFIMCLESFSELFFAAVNGEV
jgi:hypothetical protein